MNNPALLEACFRKYMLNMGKWLPDGLIDVDLELLQKLNLLHYHSKVSEDSALTRYFQVVESEEKLTLANDEFVVWIVPEKLKDKAVTFTLIALNKNDEICLETAFITSGIYNNSHLVLRILEKFLFDIHTTEEELSKLA